MKKETIEKYTEIGEYARDFSDATRKQIAEVFDTSLRTVSRAIEWFSSQGTGTGAPKTAPSSKFEENYPKKSVSDFIIHIVLNSEGETITVVPSHPNWEAVKEAVEAEDWDQVIKYAHVKNSIEHFIYGDVKYDDGNITYKGFEVHNSLTRYIVGLFMEGYEPTPLLRFVENLMQNPDKRAVDELFNFIQAGNLPITEDGCFIAYKRVRDDYTDCHTGTISNAVGQKPWMPRNMVDPDKNRTCSYGYHFCSYDYLRHFSGARTMAVKLNPADVVSIPADYNDTKGRASSYEVIAELKDGETLPPIYMESIYDLPLLEAEAA